MTDLPPVVGMHYFLAFVAQLDFPHFVTLKGLCFEENEECKQLCVTPRESCGHPCDALCHNGECPKIACKSKVLYLSLYNNVTYVCIFSGC